MIYSDDERMIDCTIVCTYISVCIHTYEREEEGGKEKESNILQIFD